MSENVYKHVKTDKNERKRNKVKKNVNLFKKEMLDLKKRGKKERKKLKKYVN